MRRFFVLVVLALTVCWAEGQTSCPNGTATAIQASWTAPVPAVGVAITGYTATITPPACASSQPNSQATVTISQCTNGATANCIPTNGTSFTWKPGGSGLYYGNWQISVVTNGNNAVSGAPLSPSTPATVNVIYAPSISIAPAPSGLSVQFQ